RPPPLPPLFPYTTLFRSGGFATRGVLLDMVSFFDEGDWVTLGRNITGNDLESAAKKQGVEVREGDVVLVRTGYLQWWWDNLAKRSEEHTSELQSRENLVC